MRRYNQLSDTELAHLLFNGQEQAFEILFTRYQPEVCKVIVHYVKDKVLAEDLSQEVFLKIYTSLKSGKYDEQGKFKPWALRIAHNLCMDHLRKAAQMPVALWDECSGVPHTPAPVYTQCNMTAKQQAQRLNHLIESLPEVQKKVVRYRYFEELSFKEISVLMNTSVNTSLGRMRYALERLSKGVKQTPSLSWQP